MMKKSEQDKSNGSLLWLIVMIAAAVVAFIAVLFKSKKSEQSPTKVNVKKETVPIIREKPRSSNYPQKIIDQSGTPRKYKILDMIQEKGELKISEIKGIFSDLSDRTLRRDLTSLEKEGLIKQVGFTKSSRYYPVEKKSR